MTKTRHWIERRRSELTRWEFGATALFTVGALLATFGLGVALARWGVYQRLPVATLIVWLAAAAGVAANLRWHALRRRRIAARPLAEEVERQGHARRGSVLGLLEVLPRVASRALGDAADRQTSKWLDERGTPALAPVRKMGVRSLWTSALAGVLGAAVFLVSGPTHGRAAAFWQPLSAWSAARSTVLLSVDRDEVRRGESVTAFIVAAGRARASLWVRAPGEAWHQRPVELDTAGQGTVTLGPLHTDRFLRAASGGHSSDTVHVRVAFPAFIAELSVLASYPAYLDRPDDALFPGDSVVLPLGTRLDVRGRATVPVSAVRWRLPGGNALPLDSDGNDFFGRASVTAGGAWELHLELEDGRPLEDPNPLFFLTTVGDSVPSATIPVPGVDTIAPLSLIQPLVVDARDDHGLVRVELVSRRVSSVGLAGEPVTETIPLPNAVTDRAVLQWVLDLNDRGFLPGDTAYYRVRAFDNAPDSQVGETREFILRLPSSGEIRNAVRDESEALAAEADSLFQSQGELQAETEALATEQDRSALNEGGPRGEEEGLRFQSAERATEIGDEQNRLMERADALSERLEQLAEAAWQAGITDPEWQQQLEDLQDLLEQAVGDEMEEALAQLRDALERLDPDDVREALQRLTEQQAQLREQLERSRELFERAALEGSMTSLAEDAEELAQRQGEWNERLDGETSQPDSVLASAEEALAAEAEQLQQHLDRLDEALAERQEGQQAPQGEEGEANDVGDAGQRAGEAATQMQRGAEQAARGERQQARESGEAASRQLDPIAEGLRRQRDEMRQAWKGEVLEAMDRALAETAELAQRQENVTSRLQRGQTDQDVRGEQAAMREGVERLMAQLQDAAGKNALVSPSLGAALGFSQLRMTDALDQLQQATPNHRDAGARAGEALDGLNAVAFSLLRNRAEVQQAQSGSGLAEAMERMAEMAGQQEALNGETGAMLPLMSQPSPGVMQQVRELAERQRSLAEELERLGAEGEVGAAEELAEDALEVARELDVGQVDRQTIERQERLFRRLLDAGRTLRSDEEDDRRERQSETARPDNVRVPPALQPGVTGAESPYPYPEWDELQGLTPQERRLILDYFRRLNERPRP